MTLTTRTIAPADVLAIPGDLPGVLAGYVGPCLWRAHPAAEWCPGVPPVHGSSLDKGWRGRVAPPNSKP